MKEYSKTFKQNAVQVVGEKLPVLLILIILILTTAVRTVELVPFPGNAEESTPR